MTETELAEAIAKKDWNDNETVDDACLRRLIKLAKCHGGGRGKATENLLYVVRDLLDM